MRNGFLVSVGALLTTASLALAQMPNGYYRPMYQAYPPAYGYYAPRVPASGYYPANPQAYNYPQGYAQPSNAAPGRASVTNGNTAPGPVVNAGLTQPAAEAIQNTPAESHPDDPGHAMPTEPTSTESSRPLPSTSLPGESIQAMPAETATSVPAQPGEAVQVIPPGLPHPATEVIKVLPIEGKPVDKASAGDESHPAEDTGHGWVTDSYAGAGDLPCIWTNLEYLAWTVRAGSLPVTLLTTTNDPGAGLAAGLPLGALDTPGTAVVSPRRLSFSDVSGVRFNVGGWFDPAHLYGAEIVGLVTEDRTTRFQRASDPNGNPALFVPFFDPVALAEQALPIATPAFPAFGVPQITGSATISALTRLWGFETNALFHAWGDRSTSTSLGFLAGFRYLDLQEQLLFNTSRSVPFNLVTLAPGQTLLQTFDAFDGRNQFFGGQLGVKYEVRWYYHTFASALVKVAIGDSHQSMTINGNFQQTGTPELPALLSRGIFAQPTNIGRHTHDEFAVIPELQLQLGIEPWRYVRFYVGYNYLYYSSVVRPGNLIDRNINGALLSVNPLPNLPVAGPQNPAPILRTTDYWAQGLNFGIELRY